MTSAGRMRADHIERASEFESSDYENCSSTDDSLRTDVGHLPMKPCIMDAIVDLLKMWIHYCTLWLSSQTADRQRPTTTDNNRLSTAMVCRDIMSEDLINLGLAMPNCLADNITGHSCDPYVLLRDRHLYSITTRIALVYFSSFFL